MSIVELQNKVNELKAQIKMYEPGPKNSGSTMTGYYTIHKKTYQYEMTESEATECKQRMKKLRYALRQKAIEEAEQWELDHSRGYCKSCHILIPTGCVQCPDCN